VIVVPAAKNDASKHYPKDIFCDKKYLYRIVLVHIASNVVLKQENIFRLLDFEF